MSQENVDLVREIYDGWSRGDFSVGKDLVSEDFEWRQFTEAVEPGSRRGGLIADSLRNLFEVYERLRVHPEELIDAGDRVVVAQRTRATARQSRVELDQRSVSVWTAKDGLLVSHEVYLDRREALRAAGLSE